jgi:hypothetical protein
MGQRTNGVTPPDGEPGASKRIAIEISTLRNEIGDLVGELDRRRREAFDVRAQLRRHPLAATLAGVGLAAVLGGAVALLVYNGRRKQRRSYKAQQLRVAVNRMMKHPERVARGEPPPSEKILAAIGTAAATLLVKRALERAVPSPQQRAAQSARPAAAAGRHAS